MIAGFVIALFYIVLVIVCIYVVSVIYRVFYKPDNVYAFKKVFFKPVIFQYFLGAVKAP
jgi:hypothetical protein